MMTPSVEIILYSGAFGLTFIGLAGMLMTNNVLRMLLALVLLESGANLLLILSGYQEGGVAPVFLPGSALAQPMNDPVPQALVLTAIVIGVGVQALALALIFRVKAYYNTLDITEIRQQLEHDLAAEHDVLAPASAHSPQSLIQAKSLNASQNTGESKHG